jgi:hypothetical protein
VGAATGLPQRERNQRGARVEPSVMTEARLSHHHRRGDPSQRKERVVDLTRPTGGAGLDGMTQDGAVQGGAADRAGELELGPLAHGAKEVTASR